MTAYTTINDPSAYFTTLLYTGNSSNPRTMSNSANAGDFKPDIVYVKNRGASNEPALWDSQRGHSKALYTDGSAAEANDNAVNAFNTNGFTINSNGINTNTNTYVAWQWKVNGGVSTGSGSESGSNPAYNHQANTTAGISIVTYTGTGSAGTVPHGLGVAPYFMIVKNRTNNGRSFVQFITSNGSGFPNRTDAMELNSDIAPYDSAGYWNDTNPTSTVFTVGNGTETNEDASNHVAWVFREVPGFSKFGHYKGTGSNDGQFVNCGFEPAWILIKKAAVADWQIRDRERDPHNELSDQIIFPIESG